MTRRIHRQALTRRVEYLHGPSVGGAVDMESWDRIKEALGEALDLEGPERGAFLEALRARDPDLATRVSELLQAEADPLSLLDRGVEGIVLPDTSDRGEPGDTLIGARIGAWRVVRLIGEGGMGSVYLAERADGQFEQTSALKVIRRGMATDEIVRRFQAERQILARLQHTNIAHVLDGGITDDDRPWFALEYVAGRPITEYADAERLSVEDRLRLFVTACQAVQFAHQSLVVHRDLKPNNILVSDEGVVKLLDFGIAKVLEKDSEDPGLTQAGARVMTPFYASPEQVRGEPATTATDVYALGVVLYELLSGHRPYGDGLSPHELEAAILTEDPERPSVAVRRADTDGGASTSASTVPTARSTDLSQLRGRLSGDLDNICLMALRKDADRRYASVSQLADDIERFLTGYPVVARGDSPAYHLRKLIARHRLASGVAAAALIGLAGTVGFYTHRVQEERDLAQLEARRAQQVADFLAGLFRVSDPEQALGEEPTASELLDRGAESVRRELASDPDVQATMLRVIGGVYSAMGRDTEAVELLEEAYEVRSASLSPPNIELAASARALGRALSASGDFERAESLLSDALRQYQALRDPDDSAVISTLSALGQHYSSVGEFEAARRALAEVIARTDPDSTMRVEHGLVARVTLARVELVEGRYDEAEELYREALATRRATLPPLHPDVLSSVGHLAAFLSQTGRFEESLDLNLEGLALNEQAYGEESAMVATSLNNIASVYKLQGSPDLAEPYQRRALALYQATYGPDHRMVAGGYNNLANILHDLGRLEEAAAMHRQSLPLNRKLFGDDHYITAGSTSNLASVLQDLGDLTAAEALFRETLDIDRRTLGPQHPFVGQDMVKVAGTLREMGRYAAAEALLDSAAAVQTEVRAPDHLDHAGRMTEEGRLFLATDRLPEAEERFRGALEIRLAGLPEESVLIALTRSDLARSLADQGQDEEARSLLRMAYPRLLAVRGEDHRDVRTAARYLERLGGD